MTNDKVKAKIERGFAQSERGEVVDGETFVAELLTELDERGADFSLQRRDSSRRL